MHRLLLLLLVALPCLALGCQPGAGPDASAIPKVIPPRPGEDQMKEAMLKGLKKPGAARVKGMPRP